MADKRINYELVEKNVKIFERFMDIEFNENFDDKDCQNKLLKIIKELTENRSMYMNYYKKICSAKDMILMCEFFDLVICGFLAAIYWSTGVLTGAISMSLIWGFIAIVIYTVLKINEKVETKKMYNYLITKAQQKLDITEARLAENILEKKEEETKESIIKNSFIRLLKKIVDEIKTLDYPDKEIDLYKLKQIGDRYLAYLKRDLENEGKINLTTQEEYISLYNELMEIESMAHKKSEVAKDKEVFDNEFGDITTLDTGIVELQGAKGLNLTLEK